MSLYATCRCGIPEGSDEEHLRTDCPLYGVSTITKGHRPMTDKATDVTVTQAGWIGFMSEPSPFDHDVRDYYALPEQLWLQQRASAEQRYGNWRGFPLYKMSASGENARIIRGVSHPTTEMFRIAAQFGKDQQ